MIVTKKVLNADYVRGTVNNKLSLKGGLFSIAYNSLLNALFDGILTHKDMKDIVVRRIRIAKKMTEAIKRVKVKSFNSFAVAAISEKLERDFKIKENCPF